MNKTKSLNKDFMRAMPEKILVTGGAGFIGSALVRYLVIELNLQVLSLDKLTYAGNLQSLEAVTEYPNYSFIQADICNVESVESAINDFQPDVIMHLAAESHVDRSIDSAAEFIQTNVIGTFVLLEVAKEYWLKLSENKKQSFLFHHVSTDEVYGDLVGPDDLFTESTAYAPSSPYSASKASSDHLVRAWYRTHGLPTVITNCSNNYGPYHFPEKLIPLVILNALEGKPLPVYGDGSQIRDWLYVDDHVRALYAVVTRGGIGETYNIGGHNEKKNIDVVTMICDILDELVPMYSNAASSKASSVLGDTQPFSNEPTDSYKSLIKFVPDRPGHDIRYAIDASKIQEELNWIPAETFESGLRKTVAWYLSNNDWVASVRDGSYQRECLGQVI